MNRRHMIRLALFLGACGSARSFIGPLWAQVFPLGKASHAVFDEGERRTVAAICERIIPATDTPGAIEAGVPDFIELMMADWCTEAERRAFLTGLGALCADCKRRFGRDFAGAGIEEQTRVLEDAEREASRYEAARPKPGYGPPPDYDRDAPFFFHVKELTVLGYYTSELGATRELKYNPVPGHFDGSYPFEKVGRPWSW